MSTSQPEASRSPEASRPPGERCTPDAVLHARTGTEVSPEDVVLAAGRDLTPRNLEWAKRRIETDGPAALDKLLP
ncbi:hypothetical protein ACFPC0_34960 [Streptomyces andamanensis]|uniref:Uncharacterized protein n=1 Tax=Streptomyces andamanensis TaxID=1565035 RepID=A0ABV8TQ42_9ACTN